MFHALHASPSVSTLGSGALGDTTAPNSAQNTPRHRCCDAPNTCAQHRMKPLLLGATAALIYFLIVALFYFFATLYSTKDHNYSAGLAKLALTLECRHRKKCSNPHVCVTVVVLRAGWSRARSLAEMPGNAHATPFCILQ